MKKFLLISNLCMISAAMFLHACDQTDSDTAKRKLLYPLELHEKSDKVSSVICSVLSKGTPVVSRWTDCFMQEMPIETSNLSILVAGRHDKERDPSLLVFIVGPKNRSWLIKTPALYKKAVMVATTYRVRDTNEFGLFNCAGGYLRTAGYAISSTAGRTETDACLKMLGYTAPIRLDENSLVSKTVGKLFSKEFFFKVPDDLI